MNNNNFLLTKREVCTEKYRTEVFLVQTEPVGRGLHEKTEVRYFSVQTEQATLIQSLLYGVRHLEMKQTKNCEIETNKEYCELKRAACMHGLAQHNNEINNKLHNFLNLFMNNL